jgi:hypothetical protein
MRHAQAVVVATCVLSTACAAMFMHGGKIVDKGYMPATIKGTFTVPKCNMTDGSTQDGPAGVEYQLVVDPKGSGIFEKSPDGSGSVITNTWSDDKADHYFGWVRSTGWEYVMPKDPAGQASRVVYVSLQRSKEGDVTKPTSPATGTCPMVPVR